MFSLKIIFYTLELFKNNEYKNRSRYLTNFILYLTFNYKLLIIGLMSNNRIFSKTLILWVYRCDLHSLRSSLFYPLIILFFKLYVLTFVLILEDCKLFYNLILNSDTNFFFSNENHVLILHCCSKLLNKWYFFLNVEPLNRNSNEKFQSY